MSEPPQQLPGQGGGIESIVERLSCYICADRLRGASLCPHCSKMGCYSCIKRWVTTNRANCPHCRAPLTESSLIRVPLFDELADELEQLPTNPLEGNSHFREKLCSQHREKVSVFCETCHLCICHECVLWDTSPHKTHNFVKLEVLLQKQSKKCEVQLKKLHEHIRGVLNQVQCVERKMEAVKGSKLKVRREMKEAHEKMSERLEAQYELKQQRLAETRQKLKGQAMQLTRATHDLENKIQTGSIASLLSENGELREDVVLKLTELQSMEIEPIPSIGELFNEMVPSYTTGVFKIHPYSQLRQQGEEVYSKPLHMCGTVWKLKIYPNGHREDTGLYLSAFLELTEGYDKTVKYQYCIEMLYNCSNKHPSRNYKKEYVSDFADGESWGYRKFYELAKLESDGFLRDDTLVLRFSVRALTNHQKCRDLATQVRRLEHKVESLQRELRSSRGAPPSPSSLNTNPSSNQKEDAPANSPSRSRSSRHQHSNSEPVSPSTQESGSRTRDRENHRDQLAVRREQERRRSEERRYDQDRRREGARRRGERERGYREHLHVTMSQQPHSSRSQSHHRPSPVNGGGYLSQQRHNESHIMTLEAPPAPQYRSHHRSSGEGLRQHRRRSADPNLFQHHFDSPISPPHAFRHTLAPPTVAVTQPQEHHHHFRRDSAGSMNDEPHYGEEFGSQASLLASPGHHAHPGDRTPRFEEGSGDEGGNSQPHPWGEPLSHTDIQINIQDLGVPHSRPSHHSALHLYHTQSQEQFVDEDEIVGPGRMMVPEGMLGGPHSSQMPPYDLYDESHTPHSFKSELASHTSALSQPIASSRRRLQSSVPDLSMLTITGSNLMHSQCLSQSVMDMSRHRGGDHASAARSHHDGSRGTTRQPYHGHLNQMPSDSHLNSDTVHHPGLKMTILARLREEPEHSPTVHHHRNRGGVPSGAVASQPARKGYQETRNRRKSPSPQPPPQPTTESSHQQSESAPTSSQRGSTGSSSSSNPELTPTNPPATADPAPSDPAATDTPTTVALTTGTLGLAGKSSSNTSLSNLNLI